MKPVPFEEWLAAQTAAKVKFAPCPRCAGAGEFECRACDGTGDNADPEANGEGDWRYCETCGGRGMETCLTCDGRGDMAWQTYLAQLRQDADALERWNARSMASPAP